MTKEQLIIRIMKECEQDGEPVTREEAEEMAEMEIKAGALKHYEQSDKPRKPTKKERKIDADKKYLLNLLIAAVNTETCIKNVKTETEFSFEFGENEYSVKLIKHRPKKLTKGINQIPFKRARAPVKNLTKKFLKKLLTSEKSFVIIQLQGKGRATKSNRVIG